MRLTSSFAVFRFGPGEQDLAKARWFGREGKLDAAEEEYRSALARNPDLRAGWLELFELQRRGGRMEAALETAAAAAAHFGPDAAMPLAMRGAALTELGRTREAIGALEAALERDGNLALAWHELAYAAFRSGEFSRALLALDRAFMLEPHTDTLMLRGRVLREAGQYDAAEVAFEAAQQSAEHDIPRRDAEAEIAATRRAATLGGKRPREFTYRERVFAESGAVVIDDGRSPVSETGASGLAALLATIIGALPAIVQALERRPAAVAGVQAGDAPLAEAVARASGAHLVAAAALDPADHPLLVTTVNQGGDDWTRQVSRLARWRSGYTFALAQTPEVAPSADLVGTLRGGAEPVAVLDATVVALSRTGAETAVAAEVAALLSNPLTGWRRRVSPA